VKTNIKSLPFGTIVRSKRESLNLSIRKVASIIKIDPSLLGKIERNERSPTKMQIELLSDCLKIDKNYLIVTSISDQIADLILESTKDIEILKIAEEKVKYLKNNNEKNTSF
jgi:transcriptional regulator with XRE-family HTH domain